MSGIDVFEARIKIRVHRPQKDDDVIQSSFSFMRWKLKSVKIIVDALFLEYMYFKPYMFVNNILHDNRFIPCLSILQRDRGYKEWSQTVDANFLINIYFLKVKCIA